MVATCDSMQADRANPDSTATTILLLIARLDGETCIEVPCPVVLNFIAARRMASLQFPSE